MVFLNVAPPGDHDVNNLSESFHVNMTYSGSVVLEKKILNDPTPFLHF